MRIQQLIPGAVIAVIVAVTAAIVLRIPERPATDAVDMAGGGQDSHAHAAEAEPERGPEGGRLLEDGDFAVEVVIHETGIPPEFRLYAYDAGTPLPASAFDAAITLDRLGGRIDRFEFETEGDYLRGLGVVREPHSFDVEVEVVHEDREYHFTYSSHEGRTEIPARVAAAQGVAVDAAGPAVIDDVVELTGAVQTDPARISEVRARFPGVVTGVRRTIGDSVRRGDMLATIETNESLRSVAIEAPIGGLIIDRHVQTGQTTGGEALFVIADLTEVWIHLDVFGRDLDTVAVGQPVSIETLSGYTIEETIDWVSPLVAHGSQSIRARVTAANPEQRLRPGQFVRARVVTAQHEVPLAVRRSGLQRFRDFDVVFARVGDVYEVRMLELGRQDADFAEVLDGLRPGEVYVMANSYLIKADIEKAGATHDH